MMKHRLILLWRVIRKGMGSLHRSWPLWFVVALLSILLFLPLQLIQKLLIVSYPHVPAIIAIFTLSVTVIIPILQKTYGDNKEISWTLWLALAVSIYGIVFGIAAAYINMTYCIVPNLHGASYDTAMEVLREEELLGRLVLAETHNEITGTNSRVVWQCSENGAIEKRGATVFFAIADNYSEYDECIFPEDEFIANVAWDYLRDENCNNWHIRIPLIRNKVVWKELVTEYNRDGAIVGQYFDTKYQHERININEDSLTNTICEIVNEFINRNRTESEILGSNNLFFVAKLVPSEHLPNTRMLFFEKDSALTIVPASFDAGNYQLVIAFIDRGSEFRWKCDVEFLVPEED